jgi:hypothetical protein
MQTNSNYFPNDLKLDISELINADYTEEQQLFVVYYNRYKNNGNFSFEHLCRIINHTTNTLVLSLITSYRATAKWDLKHLNSRIINHVIKVLMFD